MFPLIAVFRTMTYFTMVLVYMVLVGCVSTADQGQHTFVSEGSGGPIPPPGTRVMILSNHQGAKRGAAEWLQHRGFLIVDQVRVEKGFTDSAGHMTSGGERNLQIREVAKAVDAEMVISAHVGRKFVPADYGSQAMTMASVEIQGMDVQTGNVAFESKAWNSDPVTVSEGTILGLTKRALQEAWKGEATAMAPVEVVAQERSLDTDVVETRSADLEPRSRDMETSEVVQSTQSSAASTGSSGMNAGERESSLGLQVASGALSILYTPFKVVYAGLGGIIGGLAYVVTGGNEGVAQNIWDVSLQGDYWVTPTHLEGNTPLHFQGQSTTGDAAH